MQRRADRREQAVTRTQTRRLRLRAGISADNCVRVSDDPDLDPLARPLPSVDIPVLRGDVRANRAKRQVALSALGVVAALGVVYLGYQAWNSPDEPEVSDTEPEPAREVPVPVEPEQEPETPDEEPEPEQPTVEPVESDGLVRRFEARFGDARGFRPALLNAGLTNEECASLEQALGEVIDFRRCRPDHRIEYERDANDRLTRLRYHDQDDAFAQAVRQADGTFTASREELPRTVQLVTRGGIVRSSLGDAMDQLGLSRSIVGVFVEVFGARVNFATQAREGDQFRVVLEQIQVEGQDPTWGQAHALEYVGQRAGRLQAFYYEENNRRPDWYDEEGRQMRGSWLRVPCRYDRISSPFNPRRMHPLLRRIVPHNGVDFAAATGTPVRAAAAGRITWAGPKGPNGNLVSIEHEDGYSSHYAHLHQIQRGIRVGVEVEERQLIGTVGTTGRSTGPHLHFGLKRRGRFVDPVEILNGPGRLLPAAPRRRFRARMGELREHFSTVELSEPPPAPSEPTDETEEDSDETLD